MEEIGEDWVREMARVFAEALMGAEVKGRCGAAYGERSEERTNRRNGYRTRRWDTRAGTIGLAVPKLRRGSYFSDWLLEPQRRSEAGRVVSVAALIATAVNAEGRREILGLEVVTGVTGAGWLASLRELVERGPSGTELRISDAHPGLKDAIASVLIGRPS